MSLVEILERTGQALGLVAAPFDQTFQIMVVVLVQTANGDLLSYERRSPPSDIAIFRTGAGF